MNIFCICVSLCKGMDDPAKAVPDLVDCSSRRRFSSGVVYCLPEAAIFEPEQEVQDRPKSFGFVWDCCDGRDFQFRWWVVLNTVPFDNPRLIGPDLCPYFLSKVFGSFRC
jgi:hypothetical protein